MMENDAKSQPQKWLPWMIWGLAAAYFFSDYFARVSPSVMLPQLQTAFKVSAAGLGALSAYFYYPYVAMQVPVGLLVDRFSIRNLLTIMALITGVACILFGAATSLHQAQMGRFLIGFSAAFAFVSALKLAAVWFPPQRLGLLAGLTQALGMLGAAVGEAPVSLLVEGIGWRSTMMVMATVFFVLAIGIFRIVQDHPPHWHEQKRKAASMSVWTSLARVLRNPQTWWNAFYVGLVFAPTAALGELWGVSYLQHGRGFNPHVAAFANGLIFIGWGLGGPITGWLTDRIGRRKPIMFVSALMGAICMTLLLFLPTLSVWQAYLLLFLYGLTNTGVAISYAVAAEINEKPVVGASIAFANMASVIIGAFLQPVIGHLIDRHSGLGVVSSMSLYHLADFRSAMVILPLCSLAALVCLYFIRETFCRPLPECTAD